MGNTSDEQASIFFSTNHIGQSLTPIERIDRCEKQPL